MRRSGRLFLAIIAVASLALPGASGAAGSSSSLFTEPMTFHLVPQGPNLEAIVAIGDIAPDTPQKFEAFVGASILGVLKRGTRLYLISRGGYLKYGLALGRAIRQQGFATVVGIPVASTTASSPPPAYPGKCASACTFAFLGGIVRTVVPGSKFQVHRFYFDNGNLLTLGTQNQYEGSAQIEAGKLVGYIRAMGVGSGFYTLMTEGGNSHNNPPKNLDQATLARLRVTTTEKIAAHILFSANRAPILQLSDEDGGMQYGRMDFYCSSPYDQLILRAYFPSLLLPPAFHTVTLSLTGAGGSAETFTLGVVSTLGENPSDLQPQQSGAQSVDILIPRGDVFRALQGASGITVTVSGPGLFSGNLSASDTIGSSVNVPIPPDVQSRFMAVAKSCYFKPGRVTIHRPKPDVTVAPPVLQGGFR